jgi:hypothetical protein
METGKRWGAMSIGAALGENQPRACPTRRPFRTPPSVVKVSMTLAAKMGSKGFVFDYFVYCI